MFAGSIRLLSGGLLAAFLAVPLFAQDTKDDKDNPAATPRANKAPQWLARHKAIVTRAKKGDVDIVFLGDSITRGWEINGKEVWKKTFEPLKAVNFGIGGDQTGQVLWRITEGKELEPIKPKVAVLMIGTNNLPAKHTPEQIAGGVKAIVEELRKQKPDIKVLVLGIFPRGPKPMGPFRQKIKSTNALLAKLDDGKSVFYKDIGEKFLDKDGTLNKKLVQSDLLHLLPKGYQIWADAIKPDIDKLLK